MICTLYEKIYLDDIFDTTINDNENTQLFICGQGASNCGRSIIMMIAIGMMSSITTRHIIENDNDGKMRRPLLLLKCGQNIRNCGER